MTDSMTDLQMWTLIVGFFAPLLVSVLRQPWMTRRWRLALVVAASLVLGIVTAYLTGQFTGRSAVSAVLVVLVVSIAMYEGLWKGTGVTDAIEAATTVGGRHRRPDAVAPAVPVDVEAPNPGPGGISPG